MEKVFLKPGVSVVGSGDIRRPEGIILNERGFLCRECPWEIW